MSFWSSILIAILGLVNPILTFIGSTIKFITSEAKNAGFVFLFDIVSNSIDGGLGKDLAGGIVSDAIEVSSGNSASENVVPFNNIVLKCERCGTNSHYYVKKDGLITCKGCFANNIDTHLVKNGGIYLFKNNIIKFSDQLTSFNKQSLSSKFEDFNKKPKFPSLSNKYKNFKN